MRVRLAATVVLLVLAAQARADERIETGFDPKTDGLGYTNVGSYASPNGDCFGMSTVALLRFQARKNGSPVAHDAYDLPGRALAGAIQNRYLAEFHQGLSEKVLPALVPVDDPRSAAPILERLRAGTPVVVHLQRDGSSHAVLFFGFADGAFEIYDPDRPGETTKWRYDKRSGFTEWNLTYGLGQVKSLAVYDAKDVGAMPTLADLEALRSDCDGLGRACAAPFVRVDAGVATRPDGDRGVAVVVTGVVSGGLRADPEGHAAESPDQAIVFVNGQPAATVSLGRSGAFEARLPAAIFSGEKNDVRIAVTAARERLAGFTNLEVGRVAGAPAATSTPSRTGGLVAAFGTSGDSP
jgi:hypothetical protein